MGVGTEMETIQILCIDDEPAFLEMTREFLTEYSSFSVDTALSAADGLSMLEGRNYDAIVCDHEMSGMTGLELLRRLRSKGVQTPFIIFTGRGSEEVVLQAYETGANSYVQKKGNPREQYLELAEKIEKAVGANRSESESKPQHAPTCPGCKAIPNLVLLVREKDGALLCANQSVLDQLDLKRGDSLRQNTVSLLPDANNRIHNAGMKDQSGSSQQITSTVKVNVEGEDCTATLAWTAGERINDCPGQLNASLSIPSTALLGVHIYSLDQEGRLRLSWANHAAEKILGIEHSALLEEDIASIFPGLANSDLLNNFLLISRKGGFWHSNQFASTNELMDGTFAAHAFGFGSDHLMVIFQSLAESYLDMERAPREGIEPVSIIRLAQQLADTSPELDIFKAVAEQIMGDSEVVFIAFSEHLPAKNVLVCRSVHGMPAILDRIMGLLGASPVGMEFPLKAGWEKQQMLSGHLVPVPGGLYQITLGKMPRSLCTLAEKALGVGSAYSIGFVRRGELLGNAIIVLKKGSRLDRERTEAICHLAAVAIQKRIAEDALRESERRYRTLVERTADIVYSCDPDGNLMFISPQVRAYGYDPKELVGKNYLEMISPQDRPAVRENMKQAIISGNDFENRYRIITARKEIRWMESRSRILRDDQGRVASILGISRDITDKRKGEEALNLANKKLNLFNSITRHDLSNQIMLLSGYVDLAHRDLKGEKSGYLDKMEKVLEKVRSEIDFARTLEKVGLRDPEWQGLREVIEQAAAGLDLRGVSLKVDVSEINVLADPMLANVFHNMLDNSLRHGDDVRQIKIVSVKEGDRVAIVYEDDGCGISEADKSHIFEKGFGKNTGLGLFLSREILELSGFSIIENGRPGEGVRFEINIPEEHWT